MRIQPAGRLGLFRQARHLIRGHIAEDPQLQEAYAAAAHIIHVFGRPAFYEISSRCNLKCEGCYYFDGDAHRHDEDPGRFDDGWATFLAQERARGVSMLYFLGAEPALEEERLVVASRYFKRGNVGTNGTRRLHSDIPFRISISAWAAGQAEDARLRGGAVLRKALRNYEGDERAIVLYTLNPYNIDEIPTMARACRDHGLPLTFNMWSPTTSLLDKLKSFTPNDDAFFRISTPEKSLMFSDDDLARVRDGLEQAIEDFPETVIYSSAYNRWSTRPGPLYEMNPESGIAEDCGSRIAGGFRYYGMDLRSQPVKCCTPAVDCNACRLYSGGWSSHFVPRPEQLAARSDFCQWLDMVLTIGRIFLRPEIDPEAFTAMPHKQMAMDFS